MNHGITTRKVFVTPDGREFPSYPEAQKHAADLRLQRDLEKWFENGADLLGTTKMEIMAYRKELRRVFLGEPSRHTKISISSKDEPSAPRFPFPRD